MPEVEDVLGSIFELSYLAGVMDSDGFICIERHFSNGRNSTSTTYTERIGVGQTCPEAIQLFQQRWGGTIVVKRKQQRKYGWRPLFYWRVSNGRAAHILSELLPYLRIKKQQAEIVLALRQDKLRPCSEVRQTRSLTANSLTRLLNPSVVQYRTALYERLRSLHDTQHSQGRLIG